MRLLLDTHSFLWFIVGEKRLSSAARLAIEETDNEPFLSIASVWEMAIKFSLGKLSFAQPFGEFSLCARIGLDTLVHNLV